MPVRKPLRFGVMCGADGISHFGLKCMEGITKDGLAEPHLLILESDPPKASSLSTKLGKAIRFDGNLWHIQSRLFPLNAIPSYQTHSLDECLPGVSRISCTPQLKGKWSQYFNESDLQTIESHQLDFILKFAFGIVRGAALTVAKYGVWSFHHDDEEKYRGGPPAFWELYQNDPVNGALLQRLTERLDGGVVLKKCYAPIDGLSYRKNLERILASTPQMIRWVCVDIVNGNAGYLDAPPSKTGAPIYHAPNDAQMLKFWARLAMNRLRYKIDNQRIDEWNVGLVNAPQSAFLDPQFKPDIEWTEYREPMQFIADPFLLPASDGSPRILVEELDWTEERGRISEIRRDVKTGKLSTITPLIDEGVHMSYPFAFAHEGAIYAIPECEQSGTIPLYRFEKDAGTWVRHSTLIDKIDAIDSTVFQHGDRWWLMHSGTKGCGPWSLFLWHAPSPFGPWEPHPANPVKTDVTSSRPAGNVFVHEGQLYRPAQDGRYWYGYGLTINRIDRLTPVSFQETVVRRMSADPQGPYPHGFHTLSGYGNQTVVDGKKHTWPLATLIRRFMAKRKWSTGRGFRHSAVTLAPALPLRDKR